jgi:hypothetical protein
LSVINFLKPSTIKLFFLVEWVLFILFEWIIGVLNGKLLLVACLPLAFFYLLASILSALSRHTLHLARGLWLHLLVLGLVFSDQLFKTIINLTIPYQASLPIIQGWFHIANERNLRGPGCSPPSTCAS